MTENVQVQTEQYEAVMAEHRQQELNLVNKELQADAEKLHSPNEFRKKKVKFWT